LRKPHSSRLLNIL